MNITYEFNTLLLKDIEMTRLQANNDAFWTRISDIEHQHPQSPFLMHGFLYKGLGGYIFLLFEFDCKDARVLVKLYEALDKLYQHPPVNIPPELLSDFPVRE